MSESDKITDKITETMTNVFKKSELFVKITNIKHYFTTFVVISSIIGLTNIYISYCNLDRVTRLEEKLKEHEDNIKSDYEILYTKLVDKLSNHPIFLCELIDKEIQCLKPEMVSSSTSISPFSPLRKVLSIENEFHINGITEKYFNHDSEDNELLNECYDSIPLNNLKKTTGLTWLFT
jgi:hypothetical protein